MKNESKILTINFCVVVLGLLILDKLKFLNNKIDIVKVINEFNNKSANEEFIADCAKSVGEKNSIYFNE